MSVQRLKMASLGYDQFRALDAGRVVIDGRRVDRGGRGVIHSFREGNTRSQFVFFSQLADVLRHALI